MKKSQFKRVFRLLSEIECQLSQNRKSLLKYPTNKQIDVLLDRHMILYKRKHRLRQIKISL